MELLTTANAILGQGQLSLAKYLLIAAKEDQPSLDIHDVAAFLRHALERFDPERDLHFQTCTTIDTLDYSGTALNEGSKVVLAATGPQRRILPTEIGDLRLPEGFREPRLAMPGILVIQSPTVLAGGQPPSQRTPLSAPHGAASSPPAIPASDSELTRFCECFTDRDAINRFPLVVLVDDSEFAASSLRNFLWVTFTRSNPASDIGGIGSFVQDKHWGCSGSVVIDARIKPHHAPPLVEDSAVSARVDKLAARGGPLHGIL
jgi:4-hydroxy-3-polyprenylbenzoate decarboxylase